MPTLGSQIPKDMCLSYVTVSKEVTHCEFVEVSSILEGIPVRKRRLKWVSKFLTLLLIEYLNMVPSSALAIGHLDN